MLYKAADRAINKLVSLVIKHVPASRKSVECNKRPCRADIGLGIAEFEELFIESLGSSKAKSMLRRNMSTMLAYTITAESDGSSEVRVLNMMG
jgi:hypothetical protein